MTCSTRAIFIAACGIFCARMALGQDAAIWPPPPLAPFDSVVGDCQPLATACSGPAVPIVFATPEEPEQAEEAAPAPDRWLLMKALQGTYPGWLLDGERMSISGWTEGAYTASSARVQQLPMGFNYRADDFLLQQNWLRIERTVVTSDTVEPTLGFRSDWILPGSDYRFTLPRGIFNSQLTADDGLPETYGVDPVQFYGEAYIPGIFRGMDINVGRFFAPTASKRSIRSARPSSPAAIRSSTTHSPRRAC
jgi:hypothetical protein